MNKIILVGNITRDIELAKTEAGKVYCRFSLAVSRTYDNSKTDFFNCTAWEKKAEIIDKYVKKGNKLGVIGRLEMSETEKDGQKTRHHNVIVEDIEFLTPKSAENTAPAPTAAFEVPDDGDIPF